MRSGSSLRADAQCDHYVPVARRYSDTRQSIGVAVTVNVACKILLSMRPRWSRWGWHSHLDRRLGEPDPPLVLASRAGLITVDAALKRTAVRLVVATADAWACALVGAGPVADVFAGGRLHEEATLAALAVLGALVYGGVTLTLLAKAGFAALRRRQGTIS